MGTIAPETTPGFVYYYFYKNKDDDESTDALANYYSR